MLTLVAGASLLGGVGWMMTRMIFKVESITEQVMQAELDERLRREQRELDELAEKLRSDRDHRTQDYLTLLRSVRGDFEEAAGRPGIQFRSAKICEQVSLVFKAAVRQLELSYDRWELAENLVGSARQKVLDEREHVLAEVEETIDRLKSTVRQFQEIVKSEDNVDLASMREELETTMRIAKRTEERMREIENPSAASESFIRE
jgi:paraquat-inducible protein B